MRPLLMLLFLAVAALPVFAQEEAGEGGVLTRFLEDRLSGAGREVRVTGFQGALSSRASIAELTIADADGVWITLRGAVLDWSRAALLRGRFEVNELSAEEILLPRPPKGQQGPGLDRAEAQPFRLPDLPVAIRIGRVRTDRLVLGAAVIRQDAVLRIDGSLVLADGAGEADIVASRTDAEGSFRIDAAYANQTREVSLDIALEEGPGGIAAGLLNLPGGPPLSLTVLGAGPLSAFGADLALATDGVARVTGRLTLAEPEEAPGTSRFGLDVTGDLEPLLVARLRPFFGTESRVQVQGTRRPDGGLDLSGLRIATQALDIAGTVALAPSMLPERVDLQGALSGPVALPVAGPVTEVAQARLAARFDAAEGERWQAEIGLDGLVRDGLRLGRATLTGQGTIRTVEPAALTADLAFEAEGLGHDDPALAQALGAGATGTARIAWARAAGLDLSDLRVRSGGAQAAAQGRLGEITAGLPFDGRLELTLDDLSRFGPLAGRDVAGAAEARLTGRYGLLDGIFDLTLEAGTRDLAVAIPRLDPLLRGPGEVSLSAARGPAGTELRGLEIATPALTLSTAGDLSTASGGMALTGRVDDLSLVDRALRGPGTFDAAVSWTNGDRLRIERLEANGSGAILSVQGELGPHDPTLPVEGVMQVSVARLSAFSGIAGRPLSGVLDATVTGQGALRGDVTAEIEAIGQGLGVGSPVIDRLIAGATRVSARGVRKDGAYRLGRLRVETPVLRVRANGSADGDELALSARLADLALIVPGFPGAVTVDGRGRPEGANWRVDLSAAGPGGTAAKVAGTLAQDGSRADLRISGDAPLGLVNGFIAPRSIEGQARYDLALRGPPGLAALSGRVSTTGARLALPTLRLAMTEIGGSVDLSGGRASLDLAGRLGKGRLRITGPVTLTPPFNSDLAIALNSAELRDPILYSTTLNGQVTLAGPLTGGAEIGGRVDLGRTEISIAATVGGAGGPIPRIVHLAEPERSRITRERAGLVARDANGDGEGRARRPYPLNLLVSAPSQIFVRGRGLDAELGGRVRLRGTTRDVAPEGQFELIRGRLDILAERFTLSEGRVTLLGALDPHLFFVVETDTGDDFTATITLEGRASDPEVRFTSSPELPEEEVVARILFGRGLDSISPFQAAQLATAFGPLAGNGPLARLRAGTGLDNLDVTQAEDGTTEITAGKYLSDNIYSEVTVDGEGKSEVNLNLDVSRNLTVRGSVDDEGGTGIGIFFQRDY